MRAKRQDELIGIIKGGGAMRSYRICGRATSWKEIARWGKGKLSCLIEDEKGRVVAASPWSARTLNQWLGEVNAHFGRKNIAVVNLDPEVCWVVFTLRGWSAGWGYYPSEPPWRAAFLAQERGGQEFRRWRGW